VVRFDSSVLRQTLLENKAVLGSAQATLDQYIAQAKVTAEQDQLDLASAASRSKRRAWRPRNRKWSAGFKGGKQNRPQPGEEKLKVQEATINLHESSSAQKINSEKGCATKRRPTSIWPIIAWN